MKETTIHALNRLNHHFYTQEAEVFSATRSLPWEGWRKAFPPPLPSSLTVLDWGCGNGRLAHFLAKHLHRKWSYTGVDVSQPLLDQARKSTEQYPDMETVFVKFDSVLGNWEELQLPQTDYARVAVFGLMHHIPSLELRQKVLERLSTFLAPEGQLIVSFWQFSSLERFQQKAVTVQDLKRGSGIELDENDLEPGDFLLSWGSGNSSCRYAHSFSNREIEGFNLPNLTLKHSFLADGKTHQLNRYVIWERKR